jgi:hypothetical protein
MAEDLANVWAKLSLNEEEEIDIDVQKADFCAVTSRGQNCVVGKLVGDRYVSMETIKKKLLQWWKISGNPSFKVIGENLFLIELETGRDKKRVLEGRPWVVEGSLFLVEDYDWRISPTKLKFDKASFWVRMFYLPLGCMGREVGRKIGSTVGIVEEVDTEKDGVGWGKFLRVKILVDLSKPLARGRKMRLEGESILIAFQYERLPKFCFQCGMITHSNEGCMRRSDLRNQGGLNDFGLWLRADSPTRIPDRNRGSHTSKPGRNYPESTAREGRSRRRNSGAGRGDDRRRAEDEFDGDGEADEIFRESSNDSKKKRKGETYGENHGSRGKYFHVEKQTGKESQVNGNYEETATEYRRSQNEEKISADKDNLWDQLNERISPTASRQKSNKGEWAKTHGSRRGSPHEKLGSGVDNRGSPGGSYKGPRLIDVVKTMEEAQGKNKKRRGAEEENVAKAMATWKRKEREWALESEVGSTEPQGNMKKKDKIGEDRTTENLISGSGVAEADFQPRRPQ